MSGRYREIYIELTTQYGRRSYFKKKLKLEQVWRNIRILVGKVVRETCRAIAILEKQVGRNRGSNHPCDPRYEIIRVFPCLDVLGGIYLSVKEAMLEFKSEMYPALIDLSLKLLKSPLLLLEK